MHKFYEFLFYVLVGSNLMSEHYNDWAFEEVLMVKVPKNEVTKNLRGPAVSRYDCGVTNTAACVRFI